MKCEIHPTSEVQTQNIGDGTRIWQFCVILKNAKIGSNCNINFNVFIENDVVIGDSVTIKSGVQIWDGLRVGNDVFIGPNVTFTNDLVPRSKRYPEKYSKTVIEEGASLGANATIIAGNTIGRYAFVGAGSVVTKSLPPFTVWYGNPAVHQGYITKNGTLVGLDLMDKDGRNYVIEKDEPICHDQIPRP
jgi:UDP-2-acetamido-3-amino-2,3-dideoxy-glucuronate N-acetyltransferase